MDNIYTNARTTAFCPISNKNEKINVRKMHQDGTTLLALVTGCSGVFQINSIFCSRCIARISKELNNTETTT